MKPAFRTGLCLILMLAVHPAMAATAIGKVDRVEGPCQGTVEGRIENLSPATAVFLDEVITTGADARLALTFDDGTVLTLGENAKVGLDEFIYRPAGETTLHLAVAGAFRFVSGKLGAGATRTASVTTPVATIGVRGTDFWGGPIEGHFGVMLLEGAITVTTPGGSFDIDAANVGIDVTGGTANVEAWPEDKRARALATVSFP